MALSGVYDMFNERWCKQTVWLISDTHFGDAELRAGIPDRPSDEELVKIINSKVGRKDTIIHLGDVGDVSYVKQLRGYKVLICGNHDLGATNYKRDTFQVSFKQDEYSREQVEATLKTKYPDYKIVIGDAITFINGVGTVKLWTAFLDNQLFDEVYTGALVIGEKLILSHEPVDIPWLFNIHGHDHAGTGRKNHLNCCIDAHKKQFGLEWEPINMNQIMKTGLLSKTESIHRLTIDEATERKKKRGGKKIAKTALKASS